MLSSNENFLDLKNYERHDTISVTKDWEYSTMIDISTGKEYMAQFFYLDNLYLLKISGFTISQKIDESSIKVNDKQLIGSPAYLAPEVYLKGEYSKSSDVYQLLTDSKPYNRYSDLQEIEQKVAVEGNRPTFDKLIPSFYKNNRTICI